MIRTSRRCAWHRVMPMIRAASVTVSSAGGHGSAGETSLTCATVKFESCCYMTDN